MNVMSSGLVATAGRATQSSEQICDSIATSALGELRVAHSGAGFCSIRFGCDRTEPEAGLAAEFAA